VCNVLEIYTVLRVHDARRGILRVGRGIGSLGHETCKVGVEDSDILYRSHDCDVSVWSDDDDCASTAVNPVCRVGLSPGVERDADVVNEYPKQLPNSQSQFNVSEGLKKKTDFAQWGLKNAGTSK